MIDLAIVSICSAATLSGYLLGWLVFRRYSSAEERRLRLLCQQAHDRLLRGATDKMLLEILEKAWKK